MSPYLRTRKAPAEQLIQSSAEVYVPDLIFEDPRLVSIYDDFDGRREDLVHYVALIQELHAKSILDIGCGTGCLAYMLLEKGCEVVAVDPAKASIDFARTKPHAEKIRWILGDATTLPPLGVDLALMTGNVAQVFVTDHSWQEPSHCRRHSSSSARNDIARWSLECGK